MRSLHRLCANTHTASDCSQVLFLFSEPLNILTPHWHLLNAIQNLFHTSISKVRYLLCFSSVLLVCFGPEAIIHRAFSQLATGCSTNSYCFFAYYFFFAAAGANSKLIKESQARFFCPSISIFVLRNYWTENYQFFLSNFGFRRNVWLRKSSFGSVMAIALLQAVSVWRFAARKVL